MTPPLAGGSDVTGIAVSDPAGPESLANENPFALLVAMLLDQQITIEWAFAGPARLAERLGGELSPAAVDALDEESLARIASEKPALHRFPAAMARRIASLAHAIEETYDGDAAAIWSDVASGEELARRLGALPGFGPEKVRITVAVLAKRFAIRPDGWEEVARPFDDPTPRSVADVGGPEDLARLRAHRKAQKAAGRSKAD